MTLPAQGCLIISGTPAAGKTTVSRLVAETLARSARIDGDTVNLMIVNGSVGPVSEPADEAQRQLLLRARNECALANNFAEAGFYPVMDHVVPNRDVLQFIMDRLRPRPVLLVTLAPRLEVAVERNRHREARDQIHYDVSALFAEMRTSLRSVGWWFDTSDLTPIETAQAISQGAATRGVVAT